MDRPTKVESQKSTLETLREKKIAAGLAIGFGIAALAGCASNNVDAQPNPAPTSTSVEVEPSNEPVETGAPTETEKPGWYHEEDIAVSELPSLPPELEQYEAMTPEEFASLSKQEQSLYASYLTQNRAAFMEWSDPWYANPLVITPESPVIDKIEYNNYTYRMALARTEGTPEPKADGTCGPIDQDAVKKLLLASTTVADTALKDADKMIGFRNGQAICAMTQSVGDAFDSSDWTIVEEERDTTTVDGQEAVRDSVSFTTPDGKLYHVDLLTMELPTYDGKTEYQTLANYLYSPANSSARPQ